MSDEIVIVFGIDGDQIGAHFVNRDNLAEDPFGFGPTKKEALEDLMTKVGPDLE